MQSGFEKKKIKWKQRIRDLLTVGEKKGTHKKSWIQLNGEWPAIQMAFDWFPHSCFSRPVCALRQMLQAAHVCFSHTLSSHQALSNARWLCLSLLWRLLPSFSILQTLIIPKKKKNQDSIPTLNAFVCLFGKTQLSVENDPWQKQLFPHLYFCPQIKHSDESQSSLGSISCQKVTSQGESHD